MAKRGRIGCLGAFSIFCIFLGFFMMIGPLVDKTMYPFLAFPILWIAVWSFVIYFKVFLKPKLDQAKTKKELARLPDKMVQMETPYKTMGNLDIKYYYLPMSLDYCLGSGWMPSFRYSVKAIPPVYDFSPFFKTTNVGQMFEKDGVMKNTTIAARQSQIMLNASRDFNNWLYEIWRTQSWSYGYSLEEYCCFTILMDEEDDIAPAKMMQFWNALTGVRFPIIFEIVADSDKDHIGFQLLCHKQDKNNVVSLLSSMVSHLNPEGTDEDLFRYRLAGKAWEDKRMSFDKYLRYLFKIGLWDHYAKTIETFTNFNPDPLAPFVSNFTQVLGRENSGGVLQFVICPDQDRWKYHLIDLANKDKGIWEDKEFDDFDPTQKLKHPLFAVGMKYCVFTKSINEDELIEIAKDCSTSLDVYKNTQGNGFSGTSYFVATDTAIPPMFITTKDDPMNDEYSFDCEEEFISGNLYAPGFILNSQELTGLCHFPSKHLQHPKLLRYQEPVIETGLVPEEFSQEGTLIGKHDNGTEAHIPNEWRSQHTYVVGFTGTGKTTLLKNMIKQDIEAGHGVGVVDVKAPDATTRKYFVDDIMSMIPENRIDDVVLFDATDMDYPIGFNLLDPTNHPDPSQIKDKLLFVLQRATDTSWPDQMETLFMMAVDALVNDDKIHTLTDVDSIMFDEAYRARVISKINDPYQKNYWDNIFDKTTDATKMGISRRLVEILGNANSRNVLCQERMAFDFRDIMDQKKIFLAKIPRGNFPMTYKFFAKIMMINFELAAATRKTGNPFYLYVDEFQHFADETFHEVINEARATGLYLTISHQQTDQIDSKTLGACMSTGSTIVFQVQPPDARKLEPFFQPSYNAGDILNLGKYRTLTRIGRASDAFSMNTFPPLEKGEDFSDRIKELCRQKYCQPKAKVEELKRDEEPKIKPPEF